MSSSQPAVGNERTASEGLASGRLGVLSIVFFVMSAAAPLTVLVSGAPLTVRIGGVGGPGAILVCGVVLVLFAAGFTAMSQHVRNAGAFYAYATRGLGEAIGSGTAAMTTVGYALLLLGFYGFIGFFTQLTAADLLGIDLPWGWWAIGIALLVGFLGYRQVDVGANVLAVLLTAEVTLMAVLSLAVLVKGGPEPLSMESFTPHNVFFATGAGSLFVLGFGAYIGFEGTAIYAEEAKDPARTVPRATYAAIGFLALFYAFSFWCFVSAFGVQGVVAAAGGDDFGNMTFVQAGTFLGSAAVKAMQVLVVTSFLACLISFHNACSRYVFSLGRAGLLPGFFGHTHPEMKSPARASHALSVVVLLTLITTLALGWDPYLDLGLKAYASGVVAIVVAQAICALAVVAFFWGDRRGFSRARVLLAPALGALGLIVGVYLIATNFEVVSGNTGMVNTLLLLTSPSVFLVGVLGFLLKRRGSIVEAVG